MKNTDDKTDIQFRKLFQKAGLDSPSSGFTGGVMDRIAGLQEETELLEEKSILRKWAGYLGIALLAVLGLSIMYYFGIDILPDSFKPFLSPEFANVFNSFRGLLDSVELSGTTIAIVVGFAFLVLLERILSKFRATKNIYFSL
jgi:hypothetical protein